MNELARKTVSGATINVSVTLSKTVLQFAVVLPVLARIVPPEQFGLVGMAMAFVTFFTMLNDLGISAALVRAQAPSAAFWSSAFWTNAMLGALLTATTFLAAPAIAGFFGEPIVEPLVQLLSITLFMHCMFLVPMAWLQRNFRFRTIALIDLAGITLSSLTAIGAAMAGFGVWALAWQQVVAFAVKMAGGLIAQRAPISLTYKWSEIAAVLPFSLRLTGAGLVGFANRNADNILIGRFLGAEALGFYGRAYQIMLVPVHSLSLGASFALYPAMSSIQDDRPQLAGVYLRSMSILGAITLPLMAGLALVATPFVAFVFGERWHPVAPALMFLSFAGAVQALTGTGNVLWTALGRSDVLLRWSLIRMAGFVSAFAFGVYHGTIGAVAGAYLVANLALFIPYQIETCRTAGISRADFAGALLPPVVSTALMAAAMLGLRTAIPALAQMASFQQLALLVPAGIAVYGFSLLVFFRRYSRENWRLARQLLVRPPAPAQ
jgi:O-antigen/teichoic acid export membrane protein